MLLDPQGTRFDEWTRWCIDEAVMLRGQLDEARQYREAKERAERKDGEGDTDMKLGEQGTISGNFSGQVGVFDRNDPDVQKYIKLGGVLPTPPPDYKPNRSGRELGRSLYE